VEPIGDVRTEVQSLITALAYPASYMAFNIICENGGYVSADTIHSLLGLTKWQSYRVIKPLAESGLIKAENTLLSLTDRGRVLLDTLDILGEALAGQSLLVLNVSKSECESLEKRIDSLYWN
jgi:hypothetical protein